MRPLTSWTAGLVGDREPAQPLLTLYDGPARVELSGATTANWVAKSANLLVDGLGGPTRVGLLLPLHWQGIVLLLAGVATGATVVVAGRPGELAGCDVAFSTADDAQAALDVGVDDVLAVSLHPLGAPLASVPPMVLDHAREVPGHGDHWSGPAPDGVRIEVGGHGVPASPAVDVGPADRVLIGLSPSDPDGLALLLACLQAGASLVLVPTPSSVDIAALATTERVTATAGLSVPGVRSLG